MADVAALSMLRRRAGARYRLRRHRSVGTVLQSALILALLQGPRPRAHSHGCRKLWELPSWRPPAGGSTLLSADDWTMMRYALLLYADVGVARAAGRAQADAELRRYGQVTQERADEGVLRGGEAFLPASTSCRVTMTGEAPEMSDVPSSELELSGFFLVECEEERAIEIAAELPVVTHGEVEVRLLMDMPPST